MTALVASLPATLRRLDPALALILLALFLVALFDPGRTGEVLMFAGRAIVGVAPWLALSILTAAAVTASGADNIIARAFQGRETVMIVLAALIGGLSPFCSCGVIPLIAALLAMGVPLAPVMAFWLASPIMDPTMFILTAGTIGLDFAIAKTAAAVGVGLLGGYGTWFLARRGFLAAPLRPGVGDGGCGGGKVRTPKPVVWRFWSEPERNAAFLKSARSNTLMLGKWLVLAFLLEALMIAYVPADLIRSVAGDGSPLTIALAALVGIPAYLNGYAALPLVRGLMDAGMAPGAGMAFLVGGGVTSIPAAIAVFALARVPTFLLYIVFAIVGAVLSGLLWQLAA